MAASLPLPVILKIPDGSFSRGVFKIETSDSFLAKAHLLQEKAMFWWHRNFCQLPYGWRIGVLDNQPIFTCKYFMSREYWQIYKHKSNNKVDTGRFETVAAKAVPAHILDATIRASQSVGTGLYGVNIKNIDARALIIGVNDYPNIDAGIEDKVLGPDLYHQLMASFRQRFLLARDRVWIWT
jgi:glutathione synthase/RimK-type ligase-like ATP-grasp enzyme